MAMLVSGTSIMTMALALAPGAVASQHANLSPSTSVTRAVQHHRSMTPDGVECYSNIRNATGSAYVSQNFETSLDAFDSTGADDFSMSQDCSLTSITVPGQYFNGEGPAASENVTFYSDNGGRPGQVIDSQTVSGSDQSGTFQIDLQPVALSANVTYWVSVQANMDFSTGGEWGWDADATQAGSPAQWENPGEGFGTGCSTWGDLQTCLGADGPDLQFALYGDTGATSDTFAGYTAPLSLARVAAHQVGTILTPSAECAGRPDGFYIAYDTVGFQLPNGATYYVEVTITCRGGVAIYRAQLCYLFGSFDSCHPVKVPLAVGQPIHSTLTARKGIVKATVVNLETGRQANAKMKTALDPTSMFVGVSNQDTKLRVHDIDDVDSQQYSNVTIDGTPLEAFDPTAVTLYQDGQAAVAPSALGADGMSFELDYIGD
jgi:hypothetical protein